MSPKCILLLAISLICTHQNVRMQKASCIEFKRDKYPNVTNNLTEFESRAILNRAGNCMLEKDLRQSTRDMLTRLNDVNSDLRSMGFWPSMPTLSTIIHSTLSLGSLLFFLLTTLIAQLNPLNADHLVYLYDPCEVIGRLRQKINKITRSMIDSLSSNPICDDHVLVHLPRCNIEIRENVAAERMARRQFGHLLSDLSDCDLIQPILFNAKWQKMLLSIALLLVMSLPSILIMAVMSGTVFILIADLYLRAGSRLELYACKAMWPNESVILMDLFTHLPRLASRKAEKSYIDSLKLLNSKTDGNQIFYAKEYLIEIFHLTCHRKRILFQWKVNVVFD